MTYLPKPKVSHPGLGKNALGLTRRDYEGALSTLCAGCGHDSVTASIVQAFYELAIPPYQVAKMSGIGCSSKTPAYFLSAAHGFNSVHGRMPSVTTGANMANRNLHYIGVSGDGDTASIGLGQFVHAMRRQINMLYVIENNGTYGLTKGQFSATADLQSKTKKGEANLFTPIDPVVLALQMGAAFVARSFSGDKEQLVPLIKAGLMHKGFALLDVLSPCVTFNNHEGSTKSYDYVRGHNYDANHADYLASGYVPAAEEIAVSYEPGSTTDIAMHDGSVIRLRKADSDFIPDNRAKTLSFLEEHRSRGQIVTGLLYLDPGSTELHDTLHTANIPLRDIPFDKLCPGSQALAAINGALR